MSRIDYKKWLSHHIGWCASGAVTGIHYYVRLLHSDYAKRLCGVCDYIYNLTKTEDEPRCPVCEWVISHMEGTIIDDTMTALQRRKAHGTRR